MGYPTANTYSVCSIRQQKTFFLYTIIKKTKQKSPTSLRSSNDLLTTEVKVSIHTSSHSDMCSHTVAYVGRKKSGFGSL